MRYGWRAPLAVRLHPFLSPWCVAKGIFIDMSYFVYIINPKERFYEPCLYPY